MYDARIKARDVLGSQNSPVIRTLRQFIKGLVLMKNVRLRIPKMAGHSISITDGLPLSTPFVCLYVGTRAEEELEFVPLDLNLSTSPSLMWALKRIDMAEGESKPTHIRLDPHPTLLARDGMLSTRDFYKWVNRHLAPPGEGGESCTSTACFYPFTDATISVPKSREGIPTPNGGYIPID